jgi:small ligand-binding sensory domain FIST
VRAQKILENGDALCSAMVPQGVTFAIGQVDRDGVLGTAQDALHQILDSEDAGGALMYTCMSRYIMLAPDKEAEMRVAQEIVGGKIPYALSYSGGEICPLYGAEGSIHNYLHGYSFVACVF